MFNGSLTVLLRGDLVLSSRITGTVLVGGEMSSARTQGSSASRLTGPPSIVPQLTIRSTKKTYCDSEVPSLQLLVLSSRSARIAPVSLVIMDHAYPLISSAVRY